MALSDFSHRICTSCWNLSSRAPSLDDTGSHPPEPCCFCGKPTSSGRYVMEHPKNPKLKGCKGKHEAAK